MKNFIRLAVLLSAIIISGCNVHKMTPENIAKEKEAIKAVLDNYIVSIENENIELYSKIFFHDPAIVNFGTGQKERIVGWDALKKVIEAQNSALSDTKITQSDVTVNLSPDRDIAWATSL